MPSTQSERSAGDDEPGSGRGKADDPALALRARTRRRLIGAAVLLLGSIIVLPMLLDSTPRTVADDVAITVTSKAPQVRPETRPAPEPKAVEPAQPVAEPAQPKPEPVAEPPATALKPEVKAPVDSKPQAEAKPETKSEAKPEAKPDSRPEVKSDALPRPVAPAADGRVAVQVAALSSQAAAEDLQVRLIKDGFTAYVAQVTTASGIVHRVRVGPYAGRDEAQRAVERLKSFGHKATIVGG